MKNRLKKLLADIMKTFVMVLNFTKVGQYILDQIISSAMHSTSEIEYQGLKLKFIIPNRLNRFRVDTFATKEPETLEWIDSIANKSVIWDIGANVGLYSCYAAKSRQCQVYAFEPSVFNLELLARNIFINNLLDYITIVPLPLTDHISISKLNMTSMEWGGALSTFDQDYGEDGNAMDKIFEFNTVGLSMEDMVSLFGIAIPDYIKIDVDGIEHLILSGGKSILKQVKGVLVEVNDSFEQQSLDVKIVLEESGLMFKEKRHSELLDGSERFGNTYNQIWYRL